MRKSNHMSKYEMMEAAKSMDVVEMEFLELLEKGAISYEDGYIVGKTYGVKELIKSRVGMAGTWDNEFKGWKVKKAAFDREVEMLRNRWAKEPSRDEKIFSWADPASMIDALTESTVGYDYEIAQTFVEIHNEGKARDSFNDELYREDYEEFIATYGDFKSYKFENNELVGIE